MFHLSVSQNFGVAFHQIVAHKFGVPLAEDHPVGRFHLCCIARALFLLRHFGIEIVFAHTHTVFFQNEFGEVERESVGVVERESLHAVDGAFASLLGCGNNIVNHLDASGEGAEESVFFLLNHMLDERFLCREFGICFPHRIDERVD